VEGDIRRFGEIFGAPLLPGMRGRFPL